MVLSEYVPRRDNADAKASWAPRLGDRITIYCGLYARDFAATGAREQAKEFYEMSIADESLGSRHPDVGKSVYRKFDDFRSARTSEIGRLIRRSPICDMVKALNPLEQFLTPFQLAVLRILYFDPVS
jgi:hypothetical protein